MDNIVLSGQGGQVTPLIKSQLPVLSIYVGRYPLS